MKKWIFNLLSVLVGLTVAFFLLGSPALEKLFIYISSLLVNLVPFIFYGMLFFLSTAGVASLNLQKLTYKTLFYTLVWACVTLILLILSSGFFSSLMPLIDVDSFINANKALLADTSIQSSAFNKILLAFSGQNFQPFFFSFGLLMPIVGISFLLGYGITPTKEVLRPAYSVINSFSEVSLKLLHLISLLMNIGLSFVTGVFIVILLRISSLSIITSFLIYFALATIIVIFLIFPLLIVIFTKERHPYFLLSGLLSPMFHAFFSGTSTYALPVVLQHNRSNLGIAKRINSLSIPVLSLIGRGGSAFVSSFVLITMLSSRMGDTTLISMTLKILLSCGVISIVSYAFPGFEVLCITLGTIAFLGLDIYQEATFLFILILHPLLQGVAALIDTLICGVGAAACGYRVHAYIPVTKKDRI